METLTGCHRSARLVRISCLVVLAMLCVTRGSAADSAARPGVLPATHFRTEGRKLMLVFEHQMVDLVADRVGSRFKQLAKLLGRSGSIVLQLVRPLHGFRRSKRCLMFDVAKLAAPPDRSDDQDDDRPRVQRRRNPPDRHPG